MYRIGTAGWSVPANPREEGTRLERYSRALRCVEINSSFYRDHRASTWTKWAAETPAGFRFSIKAPKTLTHEAKLGDPEALLRAFFAQIEPILQKTGPVLFQLPPSLAFDDAIAEDFLVTLRMLFAGEVVIEPRHRSWFMSRVDALLRQYGVARVAADPPAGAAEAAEPAGDTGLVYYRLHGSPRVYYSNYEEDFLSMLAARISGHGNAWIVFDNTALSHAYANALRLQELMAPVQQRC